MLKTKQVVVGIKLPNHMYVLCMYVLQSVHRYGTTGYVHVIIADNGDNSDSFIILNCITNEYVTVITIC